MELTILPKVADIRNVFLEKYKNKEFVMDKTSVKTLELIGVSFIADEEAIFGELNREYAQKEVQWYLSQSLNVYDMPNPPKIWREVCDKDGYINSNYGWVIFSEENGYQYKHCVRELRRNKNTRRAMMIYTRPSMQWEYNTNGRSDFICTNSVQVLIRNDRLYYVINQRSSDAVFGYKNDIYWAKFVQNMLVTELKQDYPELKPGEVILQAGSLHVYERHFKFLDELL